jgi:hypothetical protein
LSDTAPLVKDEDVRPARQDGTCFYCRQELGTPHQEECVIWTKKVRVRVTLEYEIEVPRNWTKENIEFHRNEGTWCADNMVEELENWMGTSGIDYAEEGYRPCMCGTTHFEVVETPELTHIRDPRDYL